MRNIQAHSSEGFTLIELMVSIAIISILSAIIFASFTTARKQSRVAERVTDMKQVQAALEFYYAANRSYPSTGGSGNWRGVCVNWGSYTANNTIPGLAPLYIPVVPTDPQTDVANSLSCYLYTSDGKDYAFLDHNVPEMWANQSAPNYMNYPELVDPTRDGGSNGSVVDGNAPWAWKVYSPGAIGW